MTPPLGQNMKRNWRASWWSERGEWKSWLKTQHSKNEDHLIWPHHFMANRWGKQWKQWKTLFIYLSIYGSKTTADGDCSHVIKRRFLLGWKVMTNLDSIFKNRDITLLANVCLVKAMAFPVVFYGCESWTIKLKYWCYWTVVLEKTLESPLDWKEIKPVNPKANQSRVLIGRTNSEAEIPILWPPDVKN